MDNILNFGEEKVKKKLGKLNPEEMLEVLFDDERCEELFKELGPLGEKHLEAVDLTDNAATEMYERVEHYLDTKYGKENISEARLSELMYMTSTISMKIMAHVLALMPREERSAYWNRMKSMALMYTEMLIHRLVMSDTGEEE